MTDYQAEKEYDIRDGCECCGRWPVVVSQRCHPEAETMTLIYENGRVQVICAECEAFIIGFNTDLMEDTCTPTTPSTSKH